MTTSAGCLSDMLEQALQKTHHLVNAAGESMLADPLCILKPERSGLRHYGYHHNEVQLVSTPHDAEVPLNSGGAASFEGGDNVNHDLLGEIVASLRY
jgi:hypothetical protein